MAEEEGTDLSIKKNLKPGNVTKFVITLSFGDEENFVSSPILEFTTPNAIRSMGSLTADDFNWSDGGSTQEEDDLSGQNEWAFGRYIKKKDGDSYLLRVFLREDKVPDKIKKDARVTIKSTSGPLAFLNGRSKVVAGVARVNVNDDNKARISLQISESEFNNITPNQKSGLLQDYGQNSHSLTVTSSKSNTRTFTLNIGPRLTNGLINKNNVKDVLVVSFKQWKSEPKNKEDRDEKNNRYYFRDKSKSNLDGRKKVEKDSLSYSDAIAYFTNNGQQINKFTRSFSLKNGKNFAFFCTPVRYIKIDGNTWRPIRSNEIPSELNTNPTSASAVVGRGWLQINKANNTRWGRASKND